MPSLTLTYDGQPRARIVISSAASQQIRKAAGVLAQYVRQATGAELDWATDQHPVRPPAVTIQVGETSLAGHSGLLPPGLEPDGFVIKVDASLETVIIRGPTDCGTEFGVYDFLEQELGVRWLLPGPHGTDVPHRRRLIVQEAIRIQEPAFRSRRLSGIGTDDPQALEELEQKPLDYAWNQANLEWARFNRMHEHVNQRHNMVRLFPPAKYRDTHPHFFPAPEGGKHTPPLEDDDHHWQPCFSAADLVDEAIDNIVSYFEDNPHARTYSLSVNDSGNYCRCDNCPSPEKLSDLYYDWADQVIQGVLQKLPDDPNHPENDRRFGCIARGGLASPPTNAKLHPSLVVFLVHEGTRWIAPDHRKKQQDAFDEWGAASQQPQLGWRDYVYGAPYCVPRFYRRCMRDYLTWSSSKGVSHYYGELYPNWGEGPKAWILMRLLWKPTANPTGLLRQWCVSAVGKRAALYLMAYYWIWESFWTHRVPSSVWFKESGDPWLDLNNPSYLANVPPGALSCSRFLLNRVLGASKSAAQQARAELLEQAFRYFEASVIAYQGSSAQVSSSAQALAALPKAVESVEKALDRRTRALEQFEQPPNHVVLRHPKRIANPQLSGEGWGQAGLWGAYPWADDTGGPAWAQLTQLANTASPAAKAAQAVLDAAEKKSSSAVVDPFFEESGAPDWTLKNAVHTQTPCRQSGGSIRCEGKPAYSDKLRRQGARQLVQGLQPGQYVALAWAFLEAAPTNSNWSLHVSASAMKPLAPDKRLFTYTSPRVQIAAGVWTLLVLSGVKAVEHAGKPTPIRVAAMAEYLGESGLVYWDEILLFPTAGVE